MTKDEAYEKQRKERIALERENKKLKAQIQEYNAGTYESADKIANLKTISKLTWENKRLANEYERYKANWERQVYIMENFRSVTFDAEYEREQVKNDLDYYQQRCDELQSRLDMLLGSSNKENTELQSKINALTEELLKERVKAGNNVALSQGFICKLQKRASKALKCFVEDIRLSCIKSPLLHWDDTVIFVNTKRACMRFYGNEKLALYKAHEKKIEKVLMKIRFLEL